MHRPIPVDYYLEHVIEPNKEVFGDFHEKLAFLSAHDYIDTTLYDRYHPVEIEQLYKRALAADYTFNSAEAADDFYTNIAIRNRMNGRYLEDIEDRLLWCALKEGEGDSIKALRVLDDYLRKEKTPERQLLETAGKSGKNSKTSR